MRVIKKYTNRRLYDTSDSRYVTLTDLQELARADIRFQVVDEKSGEDITRSVLLQIIIDQERGGSPVLSTDFLYRFIRFYGDAMQGFMGHYLEKSMDTFLEQQQMFRDLFASMMDQTPYTVLTEMTERNVEHWRALQAELLASYGLGTRSNHEFAPPDLSNPERRSPSAPTQPQGDPS